VNAEFELTTLAFTRSNTKASTFADGFNGFLASERFRSIPSCAKATTDEGASVKPFYSCI